MILPGHVIRLYVLDLGLFEVRDGERIIGIPGFLMETSAGARILFDTGFPPAYATDPDIAARDGLPRFGRLLDFTADQTAIGALALLCLAAGDIDLVILSHSHIDHVGALSLFASSPILLTARERAEARPLYFGKARPIDWPDATYHPIDADTEICQGLTVIPTPGHTPGHLSALVRLPDGRSAVLAADAINRASEPAEGFADAEDPVAAMASYQRICALADRERATILYGHDPDQWPGLPKAPLPW